MGRLITLDNLIPDASWYFSDAYYSWDSREWCYEFPSNDYPFSSAIHSDILTRSLKMEIRKWIEVNVDDIVIFYTINKSYRVFYGEDRDWQRSYEQSNPWSIFYFDCEETNLMFRLRFGEHIMEVTDLHPTTGDTYEKTGYYKKDR